MLKINVLRMRNFSTSQQKKYLKAVELTENAVNSPEFKELVENYSYVTSSGKKIENFKKNYIDDRDFTREETYEYFMAGKDQYESKVDHELDVDITMFYRPTSTIGYTTSGSRRTYVNSKYFNKFDYADIGANLVHESMHNLGWGHSYDYNKTRKHTVPYAYGYLTRKVMEGDIDNAVEYVKKCKRIWWKPWAYYCWYEEV